MFVNLSSVSNIFICILHTVFLISLGSYLFVLTSLREKEYSSVSLLMLI